MTRFWLIMVFGGIFALPTQAQIKYQHIEFQAFANHFPILSLPIVIDEKALKIAEREAQMFLGIEYQRFYDSGEQPTQVAHFVGTFKAYQRWHVLLYYWFPFPSKREANDNFEIAVFDQMGAKVASQVIAGKWGEETRLASIAQIGKDIIITTETAGKPTEQYLFTENAELIKKK
jgi:hypothetical protein